MIHARVMRRSRFVLDRFYHHAQDLRNHFEERFADPRATRSDRFVWDYWHVPEQYTHLRTPAYEFFPRQLYQPFHEYLVQWGRKNLGCHDISPPWMSCYVDGHYQGMHSDYPHGPFAFVFSISPKKLPFHGGETLLIRDEILSFWPNLGRLRAFEQESVYERISSPFNRLTVFDPRVPHGVSRLKGAEDLLSGRLVIHGWFVNPRPWIEGPLSPKKFQKWSEGLGDVFAPFFESGKWIAHGLLSLHFEVLPSGKSRNPKILANTVRLLQGTGDDSKKEAQVIGLLEKQVLNHVLGSDFGPQKGLSQVTLPLIFEA